MTDFIDALELKRQLADGNEISLLDIREQGQYGEGHPFHAVPLAYSRLELDIGRLIPNPTVRIVLFSNDDKLSLQALQHLHSLGYLNAKVLQGGVQAWVDAGYTLYKGVHVPSKTFGELVELKCHTPSLTAQQLSELIASNPAVVVLDGRPRQEYKKMTIPGAICCPNAELAYRLHKLAPDASTPVVVNCAGRTRSIIGAQSLINAGVENPVYALENGTQGWYLNDFELEHGGNRFYPDVSADDRQLEQIRKQTRTAAEDCNVGSVSAEQLILWISDPLRTTYLFDVRTPEEFAKGSVTGAVHAEGGQLIQGTDLYVGVRNSRVVLYDTDGIRARLMGVWLSQMGYEVYVLDHQVNLEGLDFTHDNHALSLKLLPEVGVKDFQELIGRDGVRLIDLRPSMVYRESHVSGSIWSTRCRVQRDATGYETIVFIAEDAQVAALAAGELTPQQREKTFFISADTAQWKTAGLALETTADIPADEDCIDYLFFVHDRHDGNKQAARQYLAWETNLVSQLDEQEKASYKFNH
ncbi:MAG TPA: rhodanese-like domain-containing protein [Eoetvoesiella sp.]